MYCKDIALSTIWIRENNNIFMNGRVLIVECLTDPRFIFNEYFLNVRTLIGHICLAACGSVFPG